MYDMVQNAYTVTLVAAFVPLAAGIFWKRASNAGAIVSALFGLAGWFAVEWFVRRRRRCRRRSSASPSRSSAWCWDRSCRGRAGARTPDR